MDEEAVKRLSADVASAAINAVESSLTGSISTAIGCFPTVLVFCFPLLSVLRIIRITLCVCSKAVSSSTMLLTQTTANTDKTVYIITVRPKKKKLSTCN
jgi:hypothetical protein